ncbi:MAG: hypothetical protein AAFV49_14920 [Pseudomonadota bacterium]
MSWRVVPRLVVRSYAAAEAFYCGKLGFEWIAEGGDPPSLGTFGRDGVQIGVQEPSVATPERAVGLGMVDLHVPALDLHAGGADGIAQRRRGDRERDNHRSRR